VGRAPVLVLELAHIWADIKRDKVMSIGLDDRLKIELQCTALCYQAMYCIDKGDIDAFADLLTEDAELSSALGVFRGREHIRSWLGSAPKGSMHRHLITNLRFIDIQEDHAEAIGYNTSLPPAAHEGDSPFMKARLFELHDHYQLTDLGWRLQSRNSEIVFGPLNWVKDSLDRRKIGTSAA